MYGVPQGSVLGPVFTVFTLYSLPLSEVISDHECNFHKGVDDTKFFHRLAPPDEFRSVQLGIHDDVLSWMNSNKLMLNTDKTKAMAVSASLRSRLVDSDSADIRCSNIPLKTPVKYLGVQNCPYSLHSGSNQQRLLRIVF